MPRTRPSRDRAARTAALCLVLLAASLLVAANPAPTGAAPTSTDWLGELNLHRAVAGLPPVSEVGSWSGRNVEHARWMVYNDLIYHGAIPGTPWYTANADVAGQRSNLSVSTSFKSNRDTVDGWMGVPFHGIGLIDPDLTRVGFGSYYDGGDAGLRWGAGLDVISDFSEPGRVPPAPAAYPVVWPGNGSTINQTTYPGHETPDPLTSCPGYGSRPSVGQPLYVQFASKAGAVTQVSLTRVSDGKALDRCWFDWTNYVNADSGLQALGRNVLATRNGVIVLPGAALQVGERYRVTVVRGGVSATSTFTVGTILSPRPQDPFGSLELVTWPQKGKVRVAGWAADWSAPTTPLQVHTYIDGKGASSTTANRTRADVAQVWPELGSAHGFDTSMNATPGWRTVCVYAIDVGDGKNTKLGCKKLWVPDPLSPFLDVLSTSTFFGAITWMVDQGYASGYPDGNFKPTAPMTRQTMAAILYAVAGSPPVSEEPLPFSDVGPDHPFRDPIAWMVSQGITGGYPDGTFRPTGKVTRQTAAAFIWRREGRPLPPEGAPTFSDVGPDHPFRNPIRWMAGEGITNGYPDGTFRPAVVVNRQQMAAFVQSWQT